DPVRARGTSQTGASRLKCVLKIDLLCLMGSQTDPGCRDQGGPRDQAQRCEGPGAVSDTGAVSPGRVGVYGRVRGRGLEPAPWHQCPDDSTAAEALAARGIE